MEENKYTTDIYGSSSAPYINSLMGTYAYASNYTTVADPSEPNYIWFEAGDYDLTDACGNCEFGSELPTFQGVCTDDPPTCANASCSPASSNSSCTAAHLTAYLDDAGVSWKGYAEGITAGGSGLCPINADEGAPNYFAARHVPFVFFQDISGNPPDATNAFCEQHIVNFTSLATDLSSGTLASYVFITPNLVDDMHTDCSTCSGTPGEVSSGDDWLKNTAAIQSLITYVTTASNHSILIIDWDEGAYGLDQPMLMIAPVSTLASPGVANATAFTHSSDLKSLQEIFQVDPAHGYALLRHAGDSTTTDFASFFKAGDFP
jgi:hypothetical protein